MKRPALAIVLTAALLLAACGPAVGAATATPELTSTPEASATETAAPSATPTATLAPNEVRLDQRVNVDTYFSVQVPLGYQVGTRSTGVSITDARRETIMVFAFFAPDGSGESQAQAFFDLATDSFESVETNEPMSKLVGGLEGESIDVRVDAGDFVAHGRFLLITLDNGLEFAALGLSPTFLDTDRWTQEGETAYEAILDSLVFDERADFGLACMVSPDPNYAYTQQQPVQVGGDFQEGPARARAYLNALAGPNGEPINYERVGSLVVDDDTVLDAYEISIAGLEQTATIYVDQYHFDTLYAPDGLTCSAIFLLEAP